MSGFVAQLLFRSAPYRAGQLDWFRVDHTNENFGSGACFPNLSGVASMNWSGWHASNVLVAGDQTAPFPHDGDRNRRNSASEPTRGDCCIALNGRIDNGDELLSRLAVTPTRIAGEDHYQQDERSSNGVSDAQLLLASYRKWGSEAFDMALGDFAAVLWDGERQKLVCVRDPMGLRPLFYHIGNRRLVCGSSIRGLFATGFGVPQELCRDAVGEYLGGVIPDPQRTIYATVQRLAAGHRLEVRGDGTVRLIRYWDPHRIEMADGKPKEWYAETFRERFTRAVHARLRVPTGKVGIHVSGGFDSAALAAVVHDWKRRGKTSVETWAFSNLARERSADERKYLDEVLAWFPMPVVTTESCEYWAFRPAPVLARWQDEPHTPPYAARLEAELEAARDRGIGAILAGSGGDEVGGSSCYLFDLLIRGNIARFWPELRARARGKGQSGWTLLAELIRRCGAAITSAGASRSVRAPCWMHPELAQRLRVRYRTRRDGWYNPARCDMLGRLSYCWTDPMLSSMGQLYDYYGVELRQPFLDRRVVEWALMVPPFRFGEDGLLKAPLRKALADLMPPAITLRADKANYLYYWDLGVRVHERDRIVQMLDSSVAHHNGLIDAAKLRFEYDRYCRGAAIDRRSLWRALTMEAWLRKASN